MNRITWILALSAFVLALGFSSWHEGLWSTDATARGEQQPAPIKLSLNNPTAARMSAVPFGPSSQAAARAPQPLPAAPPELTAAAPPAAPEAATPTEPPPEFSDPQPQTEPYNTPDVDNGEMQAQQDRAAAHSSRSH